jgi:hypothetical protein
LIESIKPGIGVLEGNGQSAIAQRFLIAIQLRKIFRHGLSRTAEETAQFRFHVIFPFRANFLFRGRSAEQARFRVQRALGICARRNLTKEFGQKRIEIGNL